MLLDLIWAASAALLVCFVPGWFWARCLCAPTDGAERLAYTVALSMALVPAVALVPARLFGVTFAVTVSSALLVFLTGLVAYVAFGPAKTRNGPDVPESGPLGTPVLLVLVPAFGLALWTGLQTMPGSRDALPVVLMTAVASLVLVAGVVHLVVSVRRPGLRDPSPAEALSEGSAVAHRVLLSGVLLLALFRGYAGPALHNWPFMRGVDHYSHAVMADLMMTRGGSTRT